MSIKRIHHINFIVENLSKGIKQYEKILGTDVFEKDDLPQRGVITARAKIGEQWFVLIQPMDFDLAPGKHLLEHGEGFFLMSLEVENIDDAILKMKSKGVNFTSNNNRKGLLNWWVRDINKDDTLAVQVQLCQEID